MGVISNTVKQVDVNNVVKGKFDIKAPSNIMSNVTYNPQITAQPNIGALAMCSLAGNSLTLNAKIMNATTPNALLLGTALSMMSTASLAPASSSQQLSYSVDNATITS